jgi:hypothetical protein
MFYLCSSNPVGVPQPLPHEGTVFLEWIGASLHGMENAKAERRHLPKSFEPSHGGHSSKEIRGHAQGRAQGQREQGA